VIVAADLHRFRAEQGSLSAYGGGTEANLALCVGGNTTYQPAKHQNTEGFTVTILLPRLHSNNCFFCNRAPSESAAHTSLCGNASVCTVFLTI
jgi:hypothetical protein